ncbi:DUF664 domain-containing protein [Rhodococcus sp. BS-15]|uniref:mycothiol transferase n=1 Tax=Rhodococcus sp. BS-15 TaxID=1304954 RepID=UPI0035B54793
MDDDRTQLEAFIEDYRIAIEATLDGLTEEQARERLVPSATTLLGLLKHVTWMQRVWFEECIGGGPGLRSAWFAVLKSPSSSTTTTPSQVSSRRTDRRAQLLERW